MCDCLLFNRFENHSICLVDLCHFSRLRGSMAPTIPFVVISSSMRLQTSFHLRQKPLGQGMPSSNPHQIPSLRTATPIRMQYKIHITKPERRKAICISIIYCAYSHICLQMNHTNKTLRNGFMSDFIPSPPRFNIWMCNLLPPEPEDTLPSLPLLLPSFLAVDIFVCPM